MGETGNDRRHPGGPRPEIAPRDDKGHPARAEPLRRPSAPTLADSGDIEDIFNEAVHSTTDDLAAMNVQVDLERRSPRTWRSSSSGQGLL